MPTIILFNLTPYPDSELADLIDADNSIEPGCRLVEILKDFSTGQIIINREAGTNANAQYEKLP